MDRVTLAANIMCAHLANGYTCGFEECVRLADSFLAYAEKKKECLHQNRIPPIEVTLDGVSTTVAWERCTDCGRTWAPETTKPSQKLRVLWVDFSSDGVPIFAWNHPDKEGKRIKYVCTERDI